MDAHIVETPIECGHLFFSIAQYVFKQCTMIHFPYHFWSSRKHLHTKVTPDFHLTYSKNSKKSEVGIKMVKIDNCQYFSIKSYVVDVY